MPAFSARDTIQSTTELFNFSWDLTMQIFEETGVSLVLYGQAPLQRIYIFLFLLSRHTLSRHKAQGTKLLIGTTCVMAVVGTAGMAINLALAISIARTTRQIVHGQVAQLSNGLCYQEAFTVFQPPVDRGSVYWGRHRVDRPVWLPKSMMSRLTQFTCVYPVDGVHRPETKIPFSSSFRVPLWMPVVSSGLPVVPLLRHMGIPKEDNYLAGYQNSLCRVSQPPRQNNRVWPRRCNKCSAHRSHRRILWMRRDASHIPVDKTLRPRYDMAIVLILESGAIYCIGTILLLITSLINGATKITSAAETSRVIGSGFAQPLLNIILTFTLVYVGRIAADTPKDRNLSSSSTHIPRWLVGRQTFGPAEVMKIGPHGEEKERGEKAYHWLLMITIEEIQTVAV
ncbi:hypothetical protein DFH07DRAFT_780817 [Mycena maculata]|uniref:Uncharacterized protein n=1 Tax=Mycena maculata TaxID=230809 RepID=A0AAD7I1A7_9AGAR|nr:hypothetical protein DFH07DRAFT_780817 [Mycena maculata]